MIAALRHHRPRSKRVELPTRRSRLHHWLSPLILAYLILDPGGAEIYCPLVQAKDELSQAGTLGDPMLFGGQKALHPWFYLGRQQVYGIEQMFLRQTAQVHLQEMPRVPEVLVQVDDSLRDLIR